LAGLAAHAIAPAAKQTVEGRATEVTMSVEDEVKTLLDPVTTRLEDGGETTTEAVVDILALVGRLVVICEHLGKRIDQLAEVAGFEFLPHDP
jgi:hypothetical protein